MTFGTPDQEMAAALDGKEPGEVTIEATLYDPELDPEVGPEGVAGHDGLVGAAGPPTFLADVPMVDETIERTGIELAGDEVIATLRRKVREPVAKQRDTEAILARLESIAEAIMVLAAYLDEIVQKNTKDGGTAASSGLIRVSVSERGSRGTRGGMPE